MIRGVIVKHSDLHYYQGYHDLVSVLALVLTESEGKLCFSVAEKLSLMYTRDFMRESFDTLLLVLQLLFPLLKRFDPEVYDFLHESGVQTYFSLSWVITWFSHDISDLGIATRVFDAFFSSHPMFSLYVSAAVVMHRRVRLLEQECEFAIVHNFLSKCPEDLPYDDILADAHRLFRAFPPDKLMRFGDKKLLQLARAGNNQF